MRPTTAIAAPIAALIAAGTLAGCVATAGSGSTASFPPTDPNRASLAYQACAKAIALNDSTGNTLVSASTVDKDLRGELASLKKSDQAKAVGKAVAERALAKGIKEVVFDRGGYPYHGRVKALADGSREGGLVF